MSVCIFSNNAASTLAAPVSSGATSFTVTSGSGALFPSPTAGQFSVITLWSAQSPTNTAQMEIIYYTSRSGDTFSGLSRGQEGTTPIAFNAGDTAKHLLTAGVTGMFQQLAPHGLQAFTSTGVITVPAGVSHFDVEVWGAGGGGGGSFGFTSAGSSGGGGGYCRGYLSVTPGSVITATIGIGGAGGSGSPTNGAAGGASIFSTLVANGGGAGSAASGAVQETSFGAGGTATGGILNYTGLPGGFGIALGTSGTLSSIGGAPSFGFSPPGYSLSQGSTSINGNNGNVGCGGNGGIIGGSGGAGGNGLIIVRW